MSPPGFERIELAGDRVRLRPVRAGDAGEAYRLVSDDAVLANLAWFFNMLCSEWERDRTRFLPRHEDIIVIRSGE